MKELFVLYSSISSTNKFSILLQILLFTMLSRLIRNTRAVSFQQFRTMKVVPIPALQDNYQYLIIDENTKCALIVDPVEVDSIMAMAESQDVKVTSALVTHHHYDHAGGTANLSKRIPDVKIYGGDGERIQAISKVLTDQEELAMGDLVIHAISTPCHTSTHLCYFVTDQAHNQKAVFTGDTLFIGGCGRFFEGTAKQMNEALNVKLASLPDETSVYCGHEYTLANLKFATHVEPDNKAILEKVAWAEKERGKNRFTIPSTIGQEKTYNPFMRCEHLMSSLQAPTPVEAMAKLREMKNNFS